MLGVKHLSLLVTAVVIVYVLCKQTHLQYREDEDANIYLPVYSVTIRSYMIPNLSAQQLHEDVR